MKIQNYKTLLAVTAVASLCLLASNVLAQSASTTASQAVPQLSYGVSEVLQLTRANVGEDVIVTYVQNSGNAYGLEANQILYLKQQGISERIINAMLTQPKAAVAATTVPTPATPAPQPYSSDANGSQPATTTPPPAVSYVQTAPPQTVYVIPDTQTYDYNAYYYQPYYYPAYAWYPPVTFSFGWGWGGYYGGYRGGWHGGGGFHGGNGGFHGGNGGFHSGGGGFHGGGGHR
jgi:uncharacterized membrane protein YgcG